MHEQAHTRTHRHTHTQRRHAGWIAQRPRLLEALLERLYIPVSLHPCLHSAWRASTPAVVAMVSEGSTDLSPKNLQNGDSETSTAQNSTRKRLPPARQPPCSRRVLRKDYSTIHTYSLSRHTPDPPSDPTAKSSLKTGTRWQHTQFSLAIRKYNSAMIELLQHVARCGRAAGERKCVYQRCRLWLCCACLSPGK